jgi:glyoxylase-like metal-dependent hydrolase (beta-lactamase superfamily II)
LPVNLDLGGLTAVVEAYPGHSGTDLIVRVPAQNGVYTGDLLFNNMYPVAFDEQATVSGWRSTLKTFLSWDKDTIFVPGHGQLSGRGGVQLSLDLFDDVAAQAKSSTNPGCPRKMPPSNTLFQTSSKASPFLPGICPSARPSRSFTRNGAQSK